MGGSRSEHLIQNTKLWIYKSQNISQKDESKVPDLTSAEFQLLTEYLNKKKCFIIELVNFGELLRIICYKLDY